MDNRISNKRLIYAITDYLTESQIREVIQDVLNQAEIKDRFHVNVVHYKGKMCKYSYIWACTENLFNFLVKFGANGKISYNKVVKIDESKVNVSKKSVSVPASTGNRFGLLDMTEIDDSVVVPVSKTEVIVKEIILPAVKYSEEKLKEIALIDPKYTNKSCVIEFNAALFRPIDDETDEEKRVHNVWYADRIPKFITTISILNVIKDFTSDPNKKAELKFSKNKKMVHYPHINMKDSPQGKKVWVTFDPDSHDGQAALLMCKQLPVREGNIETKIYFKHFVNKYRDDNSDSDSYSDNSGE